MVSIRGSNLLGDVFQNGSPAPDFQFPKLYLRFPCVSLPGLGFSVPVGVFWFPLTFLISMRVCGACMGPRFRGSAVPGNKFSGGRQVSRFPVRSFCFPLHRLRGKVVQEGWKGVFGFCRRDVRQIPLTPLEPSLPPQKSPTAPSSPSAPMITIVTISTHHHQHHHHQHLHPRSPSAPSSPSAPMITIINSITIITIIIITIITITTIITIITTTINTVNTLSPASTTSAWASPLSHYHTSPVIFTTTMTTSIPIPTITTSPTSQHRQACTMTRAQLSKNCQRVMVDLARNYR